MSDQMEKTTAIETERIQPLNGKGQKRGDYVLYWMQQSQRAAFNHALEYAVHRANLKGLGVLVGFGLTEHYPEANLRHYRFMLEGLQETQRHLARRGIKMVARWGEPPEVALELAKRASLVVCDRGYLRHQKRWRAVAARKADCEVVQVESDVVVPVETVSSKAEYAARTIRPKIQGHLDRFLNELHPFYPERDTLGLDVEGLELDELDSLLGKFSVDLSVRPVGHLYKGGTDAAKERLQRFLKGHLPNYETRQNQPHTEGGSQMSMYLHFGQISPIYIALEIRKADPVSKGARQSYLEELIVRRELAHNFVNFTRRYDSFRSLPRWALKTLEEHKNDKRNPCYTKAALEAAETLDPYWNAAMKEMAATGFLHNHMRMYWGKKIIEWSKTPESAYRITLELNNKYFLDGRDPNSFANVGWLFGLHDRPWKERKIFGKVRYMSRQGLDRKYDMQAYLQKIKRLTDARPA